MSKKQPIVHCVFPHTACDLTSLLQASFRLYLQGMLCQNSCDQTLNH